jgi:hypothetical protein
MTPIVRTPAAVAAAMTLFHAEVATRAGAAPQTVLSHGKAGQGPIGWK